MDERVERERLFHDEVFRGDGRAPTARFYSVNERSRNAYLGRIAECSFGKKVLEYGCGPGSYAFFLARNGAEVVGIDISGEALAQAREHARREGLEARVRFEQMNAEELAFPAASFDLVCGTGILHHLDLGRALSELSRVLRPGGTAVFFEPMGHNPLINLFRRLTPSMRTPDEHPLLVSDLERARLFFEEVDARFFHLTTLLTVPLRRLPLFGKLVKGLGAIDGAIFSALPASRRYAWQVVLQLRQPIPPNVAVGLRKTEPEPGAAERQEAGT